MPNRTLALALILLCLSLSFLSSSQHSRLAPAYPIPLFLQILYDDGYEDDCNTSSSYSRSNATPGLRSPNV